MSFLRRNKIHSKRIKVEGTLAHLIAEKAFREYLDTYQGNYTMEDVKRFRRILDEHTRDTEGS